MAGHAVMTCWTSRHPASSMPSEVAASLDHSIASGIAGPCSIGCCVPASGGLAAAIAVAVVGVEHDVGDGGADIVDTAGAEPPPFRLRHVGQRDVLRQPDRAETGEEFGVVDAGEGQL